MSTGPASKEVYSGHLLGATGISRWLDPDMQIEVGEKIIPATALFWVSIQK